MVTSPSSISWRFSSPPPLFLCPLAAEVGHQERERERERPPHSPRPHLTSPQVSPLQVLLGAPPLLRLMLVRLFLLPSFSPPHDDGLAVADGGRKGGKKWRAFGGNVELRLTGWLHFHCFNCQDICKGRARKRKLANLQNC